MLLPAERLEGRRRGFEAMALRAEQDRTSLEDRLEGDRRQWREDLVSSAAAGYTPGREAVIALDPAATSFYVDGAYRLERSGRGTLSSREMTDLYRTWVDRYPTASLEDGLAEEDWEGFREHNEALSGRVQIVGDDLYVTNPRFISRGIREKSTNAVLIKLNQIGTVTETVAAIDLCRSAELGSAATFTNPFAAADSAPS